MADAAVGTSETPQGTGRRYARQPSYRVDSAVNASVWVDETPPSVNTNRVRSHWTNFHRLKMAWQDTFEKLLMAAGLPRPIPVVGPLLVTVTLRFPVARRRDSENFRVLLSKSLGDALVRGRWLDDDTDRDWRLQVVIDPEKGPRRTTIDLEWEQVAQVAA